MRSNLHPSVLMHSCRPSAALLVKPSLHMAAVLFRLQLVALCTDVSS